MPIYLSASSIKDFISCPQKVLYRFKKTVQEVRSKDMIVGEIAHLAVEKGWRDRERAYSIVANEVSRNKLKNADKTNLEFMMDMFFLNFQSRLGENDLIEYRFKVPLYDDVFIVGKMDRVSKGNIFDWKSSSRIPSRLGNDVQCIVYDWAFTKLFDKSPTSICVASLSTGELTPYFGDKLFIDEVFNNIIPRMIRTIKHDSYERLGMFNHGCFRCPYKIGCLEGVKEDVLDNSISPE